MGQQDVYDFLKKHPKKWYTSKEIAGKMKASIGSVTNNLAKLRKDKFIIYKISGEKANRYLYKYEE